MNKIHANELSLHLKEKCSASRYIQLDVYRQCCASLVGERIPRENAFRHFANLFAEPLKAARALISPPLEKTGFGRFAA